MTEAEVSPEQAVNILRILGQWSARGFHYTPFAEYVKHEWAGAWMNSLFRNEGPVLSSDLIRSAVAATRMIWPEVPPLGMVTFVDPNKTRHKRDPGRCYRKAGFKVVGKTKSGLIALQLLEPDMPDPAAAYPMIRSILQPAI